MRHFARTLVSLVTIVGLAAGTMIAGCSAREKSATLRESKKSDAYGGSFVTEGHPSNVSNSKASLPAKPRSQRTSGSDRSQIAESKSPTVTLISKPTATPVRLPRFFSGLVDDDQRRAIVDIQSEYRSKIQALENELAELREAEIQAMEQVLSEAQRKLLKKKREQSSGKLSNEPGDAATAEQPKNPKRSAKSGRSTEPDE